MKKLCYLLAPLMPIALTLPAMSESYKTTYPDPCDVMWSAAKDALSNKDNYNVKKTDNAHMQADFQPKHQVHFDVSGVLLQRENHVTMVPKGPGCEMQVISNYSGWGHDDQSDFRKRVEASLAKLKGGVPKPPPATESGPATPTAPDTSAPQSK
jgi:hypothetical protein